MPVDLPCHLSIGRLATDGLNGPVGWPWLAIDPRGWPAIPARLAIDLLDWPATTARLASPGRGWRQKLATAGG